MKKLTLLLSVLMVAFSSVFAQDPVLSLNPHGKQAFAAKSFVRGENIVLLDTLKAAVTAENVEKATLAVAKKDASSVFKAEFNEDSTELWVSYAFAAAGGDYEDSVIVSAGALADTLVVSLKVEENVPVIAAADAIEWGTVELADAKAGIQKEIAAGVSFDRELSVELSGAQMDNYAADIKDGKLVVKLTAQKAGLYNAVAILKAPGADNKEVKLSAFVKLPDPVISVKPAEWSVNLTLQVGNGAAYAQAEKAIVIASKYLIDDLIVTVKGGKDSKFAWDEENQKVTFYTNIAGVFRDTLLVSSEGAETQKVALTATVQMPAPQLTVKPAEWQTSIEMKDGKAEAERSFSISGKYLIADIVVAVKEAKSPFVWNDEEQKVSFSASEAGTYKGTLLVSTEGAEPIEVAMEVEVKEEAVVPPTAPVITVGATELAWGEVELDAAQAGIAKETTASVTEGATLSVEVSGAQAANFKAELKDGKLIVTFKASAAGAYAALATLKAEGAESKTVALNATVKDGGVVPPQPGGSVTWITDPSELKAGDKIVITNSDKSKAMSTAQTAVEGKSYYRGETDFNENNISADVEQIELVASGSNFKLKVTGGYLYFDDAWMTAGTGGKKQNWLGTNETGSEFKFEKTEDGIYAVEVKNDGLILYNSGSPRFSHYSRTSSLVKSGATWVAVIGGQSTPAAVTGVTLDKTAASVQISKTITLTANVLPANAGNKNVTWASDNEAVATVANGVVTGVAEGTANITVTTVEGGFTAKCVVTVTKEPVVPTTPVITVGATELAWGEVEAAAAQAGIAKETTASVTEGATLSVEISGAQAANFKAELKDGKLIVTFKASAAGAYAATATLKAEGAESKAVALSATVKEMAVEGITVAEALQLGAPLADQEVSAESYTIIGYVSAMQNSEDGGWAQYGNQIFWIADDPTSTANSNADGAFEVYQGVCSEQVYIGDKVYVVTKLKNYKGTIESETKAPVTIMVKGPNHPAGGGGETEEADVVILGADFAGQGTANTGSPVEVTKDGITFTCDKGYSDDEHQTLRCYKNSVITITSATEQIGKFVFQFYSTYDGGLDKEVVVNAKEWTYTLPAQARIEKLSIFFGEYEKPDDPGEVVPELPDGVISCDSAVVLAAEIADPVEVKSTVEGGAVVVRGWVSFAYDASNGKQSAWLSDTKGSKSGVIQGAYLQVEEAVAVGDYVEIEGTLAKYLKAGKDGAANEVVIEVINGTMKKVDLQGIENVVLTEKAQKVMIDGVLYIIRDNKMYNIQGVRVR